MTDAEKLAFISMIVSSIVGLITLYIKTKHDTDMKDLKATNALQEQKLETNATEIDALKTATEKCHEERERHKQECHEELEEHRQKLDEVTKELAARDTRDRLALQTQIDVLKKQMGSKDN